MTAGTGEPQPERQATRGPAAAHVGLLIGDQLARGSTERDEPRGAGQRAATAGRQGNRRRERAQTAAEAEQDGGNQVWTASHAGES